MNILHVVHRYYPSIGGTEKLFQVLSEKFAADGHKVTIFTTSALDLYAFWNRNRAESDVFHEFVNSVEVFRFKVKYLYWHNATLKWLSKIPSEFFHHLFAYPNAYIPDLFKQIFKKHDFDIVHSSSLPYNSIIYPAFKIAKHNNIPFVLTPHVHTGEPSVPETIQTCTKPHHIKLMTETNRIITKSEIEKRAIMKFGIPEEKLFTIVNGIESSEIAGGKGENFREKFGIKQPFMLHLSQLSKPKGTYFIIDSMKLLWEQGLDFDLVLAGSKSDDFDVYINSLEENVRKHIIVLNRISDEDKKNALAACDIFAMPSIVDAFGLVFLEAWFYKKPIIGAFAGGVPEVIEDGINGFLVPFNDRYMLSEIISKLYDSPSLRKKMGENGYRKVIEEYNWDKAYNQTKILYEETIDSYK